jgi:heat shock protein HtpX
MLGALAWFVIAWFAHQTLIGMATGAKGVSRTEAPKLYNTLENLCVSRGCRCRRCRSSIRLR